MRVLIYYEQQGYGGVDTHLAHLINYWPNPQDQLIVVSNPDNKGLEFLHRLLNNPNAEVRTLDGVFDRPAENASKWNRVFVALANNARFRRTFSSLLDELKPDILLSNNGGYPGGLTNWMAALIARKSPNPSALTYMLVHHAPVRPVTGIYSRIVNRLVRKVLRNRIPVVTVSNASKTALEQFTPLDGLHVIYNGVASKGAGCPVIDFRSNYHIADDRVIIGMIGPVDPHKGHATVIEAISQSPVLQKNAHFVVVGAGEEEFLEKLNVTISANSLDDVVTFTGFLSGDSASLIRGFDLLVMPTVDFEGFGYSMAEAMLCGIPVAASRVGAIPEVIEHNVSGILIEPCRDMNSGWIPVLEEMVQNSQMSSELGKAGRERIEKHFSAKVMSQQYHDFMNKLV